MPFFFLAVLSACVVATCQANDDDHIELLQTHVELSATHDLEAAAATPSENQSALPVPSATCDGSCYTAKGAPIPSRQCGRTKCAGCTECTSASHHHHHPIPLPILFAHVHKGGGSSFCDMFRTEGLRVTGPSLAHENNGMIPLNCICPLSLVKLVTGDASGAEVANFFRENELDLCMLENVDSWPGPNRLGKIKKTGFNGSIATVLRDPYSRFLSNFERDYFLAHEMPTALEGAAAPKKVPTEKWTLQEYALNAISPTYQRFGVAVPNHNVRFFSGRGESPGSVQPTVLHADMEAAMRALRMMDAVIILEDADCGIKRQLGLRGAMRHVSNNPYSADHEGGPMTTIPEAVLSARNESITYKATFSVDNDLDVQLYHWALKSHRCGCLT